MEGDANAVNGRDQAKMVQCIGIGVEGPLGEPEMTTGWTHGYCSGHCYKIVFTVGMLYLAILYLAMNSIWGRSLPWILYLAMNFILGCSFALARQAMYSILDHG